jgi:hypothetical protein
MVPEGISSYASGIFHITEMNNLSDIFRYGLHPGGKYKFSRLDVNFMAYFPTDPRNEHMQYRRCRKLHIKRKKVKSNLVVLSIQPRALWREEVRLCMSNGFLLMDKMLPAKYIEAVYELEYDEAVDRWKHQLLYHQLAAKLTWQGCKSGKPANIQNVVDLICEDPAKRIQLVQECEQNYTFRRECHREARQCPPECVGGIPFPGIVVAAMSIVPWCRAKTIDSLLTVLGRSPDRRGWD